MKTRVAIHLLFLLSVIFLTADLRADWSSDWKQTVAAAKKVAVESLRRPVRTSRAARRI